MAKKKRSKKPKTVVFGMNAAKAGPARKPDTAGEATALHMRHLDRLKKRLLSVSEELADQKEARKLLKAAKADSLLGMIAAIDAKGMSAKERSDQVANWRKNVKKAEAAVDRKTQEIKELREKRGGILRQMYEEIDEPTGRLFDP